MGFWKQILPAALWDALWEILRVPTSGDQEWDWKMTLGAWAIALFALYGLFMLTFKAVLSIGRSLALIREKRERKKAARDESVARKLYGILVQKEAERIVRYWSERFKKDDKRGDPPEG